MTHHEHLEFNCRDIGMACDFRTRAHTEGELMDNIVKHADSVHGITDPDEALVMRIKGAVRMVKD